MFVTPAYEEIIDFIASGTSPEKVIAFRACLEFFQTENQ
jgi:hypothetical protein